jgi:predicted acetyltransferase
MAHLATPSRRYRKSYLAALREVKQKIAPRAVRSFVRAEPARSFLLVDGGKYVGLVQIRVEPSSGVDPRLKNHVYYEIRPSMRKRGYGTMALGLALKKARRFGLAHIIVVCRKSNVGSRKIIEKNGGKLLRAVKVRGYPQPFLKYHIDL